MPEITDLEIEEISLVAKAANKRKFLLVKSDLGEVQAARASGFARVRKMVEAACDAWPGDPETLWRALDPEVKGVYDYAVKHGIEAADDFGQPVEKDFEDQGGPAAVLEQRVKAVMDKAGSKVENGRVLPGISEGEAEVQVLSEDADLYAAWTREHGYSR